MKGRYSLIEYYNGLFDSVNFIAVVDNLFDIVKLVEILNETEDNPCYSYDFRKNEDNVDELYDWVPCSCSDDNDDIGMLAKGLVIDCKNYEDFLEKKEREEKKNEN